MVELTCIDYIVEYKNRDSYWQYTLDLWLGVLWTLLQTYALKLFICLQFIWLNRNYESTSIDSKQTSSHSQIVYKWRRLEKHI